VTDGQKADGQKADGQKTVAVIAAIGVVVAAVVAGIFGLMDGDGGNQTHGGITASSSPTSSTPTQPSASGRIVEPRPGQDVASNIDVRGYGSTPDDQVLWVLLKSLNNHYYTVTSDPAPVDIDAAGDWIVRGVGIGKEGDKGDYELVLVVAPRDGSAIERALARRGPRLSADFGQELPEGTRELHRITVTLPG
jgi:hypothetical protein